MSQSFQKVITLSAALAISQGVVRADDRSDMFVVHEWGTFTSLQGADGRNQEGMHHEEERLPSFVEGRCGDGLAHGDAKCADFMPEPKSALAVTQKMETPVIYFYGGEGQKADVTVQFPNGLITQWFPAAAAFAPKIGQVDAVAQGSMTWQVDIKGQNEALSHQVEDGNSWLYARDVDANALTVGSSTERFIFYRGLAQFDTPFRVESDPSGQLRIINGSHEKVPAAFLLGFDGQKGFVQALGPIAGERSLPGVPTANLERDTYLKTAQRLVQSSLEESGLYRKEALSMVKTWEHSYFLTPGLRVLYVLPRTWTDRLLPLSVKPEPKDTVRTLVGRIEVMTRQEEIQSLTAMTKALDKITRFDMRPWGRLQEAKLRRLLTLSRDEKLTKSLQQALGLLDTCKDFPCR